MRGAGISQKRTYNCLHAISSLSPSTSDCSQMKSKMPWNIVVEVLHPVHKEDGVYKISTKTNNGDMSIDTSDWFVDKEEQVPSQTRTFPVTFRRLILKEFIKHLSSVFVLKENNIFKKSKIFLS